MKSSTLHRSNLSKERMVLLEELRAKSGLNTDDSKTPGVYIRPSKEKELDVLWQNFKVNQREMKSPGVYLAAGFIAGVICMFLMTALLSFTSNSMHKSDARIDSSTAASSSKLVKREKPAKQQQAVSIIPADVPEQVAPKIATSENYTIKSGDTLEAIVYRFYGKYDSSKVTKIMEVNNISNANSLSIGQTLIIPLN